MANLGSLWVMLGLNTKGLNTGMTKATSVINSGMGKINKNIKTVTASVFSLNGAFVGLAAGASIGMLTKKVTDLGINFERSMNVVRVIAQATTKDMIALTKQARKMGATTEFTATQSADALKFLALAGLSVNQQMQALPQMLDLATAAQLNLATAADISTNIMTQMGMTVSELVDINDTLVAVQSTANTNVEQAAQAFIFAGVKAKAFGLDVQETAALIGLMANAGIRSTMAGTTLRQSMIAILSPSQEARKVLGKYNITIEDGAGKLRNYIDVLADLSAAHLSAAEIVELFGARGGQIEVILNQGGDAIRKYIERIRSMEGVSKSAADTIRSDLRGQLDTLWSSIEEVGLKVFALYDDRLSSIFGKLTSVARATGEWTKANKELISIRIDNVSATLSNTAMIVGKITGLAWKLTEPMRVVTDVLSEGVIFHIEKAESAWKSMFGTAKSESKATVKQLDDDWRSWFKEQQIKMPGQSRIDPFGRSQGAKQGPPKASEQQFGSVIDAAEIRASLERTANIEKKLATEQMALLSQVGKSTTAYYELRLQEIDALENKLALAGVSEVERESIMLQQKRDLQLEHLEAMAETQAGFGEQMKIGIELWAESTLIQVGTIAEVVQGMFTSITDGLSGAFTDAILGAKSLSESFKSLWNNMVKNVVMGLVKMGVQRLILMALNKKAIMSEHMLQMKTLAIQTFGAIFKSISAIPIIGPALAFPAAVLGTGAMLAGALAVAHSGMENIPETGSYYLKAGERVIAPEQNADLTEALDSNSGSGLGGGRGDIVLELDGYTLARIIAPYIDEGSGDKLSYGEA